MEMMLIPFLGQGHVFPCTQLCLQLAAHGVTVTIVVPTEFTNTISAACDHPLVRVAGLDLPPHEDDPSPMHLFVKAHLMNEPFSEFLARRTAPDAPLPPPVCIIVDALVGWAIDISRQYAIPAVGLYTNGTCPCALDYISPRLSLEKMNPDEIVAIPGVPDTLRLTYGELVHKPPPGRGPRPNIGGGGPRHGDRRQPPWISQMEGAAVILCNTCDELERPFIDLIARETGKKAFGVGPLLPRQFWESAGSPLRDGAVRSKKNSNVSEEEVEAWLESKPPGSVVFVSFGSEVSPTTSELAELAAGLEESGQPFIWVIQANVKRDPAPVDAPPELAAKDPWLGVVPGGFEERVGERGLVIRGWAPQLLILSHPSTGGFISHCGWNSTLESLVRGVPILAWPIRGDQHMNAIVVANHLGVGVNVLGAGGQDVRKEDVVRGVAKLMSDSDIRNRAAQIKAIFSSGFPASSSASLDAFIRLFGQQ